MSDWINVIPVNQLANGEQQIVDVDGVSVIVLKVEDNYYAIENICSHDGGALSDGWVEDTAIVCPRHGAKFCLKTGDVLAPPAYEPISTFAIQIQDGMIQVRDTRWD